MNGIFLFDELLDILLEETNCLAHNNRKCHNFIIEKEEMFKFTGLILLSWCNQCEYKWKGLRKKGLDLESHIFGNYEQELLSGNQRIFTCCQQH